MFYHCLPSSHVSARAPRLRPLKGRAAAAAAAAAQAFEKLFAMAEYGGKYCSFTPGHPNFVDAAEYQALVDAHIAFKDMSADR